MPKKRITQNPEYLEILNAVFKLSSKNILVSPSTIKDEIKFANKNLIKDKLKRLRDERFIVTYTDSRSNSYQLAKNEISYEGCLKYILINLVYKKTPKINIKKIIADNELQKILKKHFKTLGNMAVKERKCIDEFFEAFLIGIGLLTITKEINKQKEDLRELGPCCSKFYSLCKSYLRQNYIHKLHIEAAKNIFR